LQTRYPREGKPKTCPKGVKGGGRRASPRLCSGKSGNSEEWGKSCRGEREGTDRKPPSTYKIVVERNRRELVFSVPGRIKQKNKWGGGSDKGKTPEGSPARMGVAEKVSRLLRKRGKEYS